MFPCPHCHKPIEIGIAPDGKVPWYQLENNNAKVSLGCGTLVLIAIIVAACSGGVSDKEFEKLRTDVARLEQKIDALTKAAEVAPKAMDNNIDGKLP